MKRRICKMLIVSLLAVAANTQAGTKTHSKAIVVEQPADLPELAQRNSEAMYLHETGDGRTVLYLEQDQGRTLTILDVSDPSTIERWRRCPLARRRHMTLCRTSAIPRP